MPDPFPEPAEPESAEPGGPVLDGSRVPAGRGGVDRGRRRARWVLAAVVAVAIGLVVVAVGGGRGQRITNPDPTPTSTPVPGQEQAATDPEPRLAGTELGPDAGTTGGVEDASSAEPTAPETGVPDDPTSGSEAGSTPTTTALGLLPARELEAVVDSDPSVLWVDPVGGDDDEDGQTPDRAWSSLQTALDRVQPGQTLSLMTGTYDETRERVAHYILDTSGRPDAWIRITAGPGQRPVLVATGGNGLSVRGSYVEVSGLEVVGRGFDATNAYGWGLLVREADHVRFVGNRVSGMPVGGIAAVDSANIEIRDNEVLENSYWGTEQGSGISIWHAKDRGTAPNADGYHDVVAGNVVYRNENKVPSRFRSTNVMTDGNGIIIDQTDETGYTGRTLVANNVVFDNGGRGILVLESSRVDVVHNTTYANGRTAALEGGPVELAAGRANDVRFVNNLAWSRPGAPALRHSDSTGVVTEGNLLVSSNPATVASDRDRVTLDGGLAAPGVDPGAADFRPRADSPAVGVVVEAPGRDVARDIDGRARTGPVAAGAHQAVGAGPG